MKTLEDCLMFRRMCRRVVMVYSATYHLQDHNDQYQSYSCTCKYVLRERERERSCVRVGVFDVYTCSTCVEYFRVCFSFFFWGFCENFVWFVWFVLLYRSYYQLFLTFQVKNWFDTILYLGVVIYESQFLVVVVSDF